MATARAIATTRSTRATGARPASGSRAAAAGSAPPRQRRAGGPAGIVRAPVGQVQDPGTHERGRAVGRDVGQPDGQRGDRRVDLDMHDDDRHPEHLESLVQLFGCRSDRRPRPVGGRGRARSGSSGSHDSGPRVPVVGRWRKVSTPGSPSPVSLNTVPENASGWDRRAKPASGPAGMPERLRSAYSCSNHTSGGSSSQPLVTPLRCRSKNRAISCSSSRLGPGDAELGHECTQFPTSVRALAERLHAESRVDVRVMPPADVEDRRFDRVVVRSEGPLPPVRPVGLVLQPGEQPRRCRVEPGKPFVAPGRAAVRRFRGMAFIATWLSRTATAADGHAPARTWTSSR